MPSKRVRAISFTLNNYTDADAKVFESQLANYTYGVVGKEVGDSGTKHLQGYVKLAKQTAAKKAFNQLAELFDSRPHMEASGASAAKNRVYCTKDGDFIEFGELPKPGKRADLDAYRDAIVEGKGFETCAMEHTSASARYYKWGEKLRSTIRTRVATEELKAILSAADLRPWQQDCLDKLRAQDDRTVLWIWEPEGGCGKTFMAKWLYVMESAFYCEGGKKADIAYAYKYEETVVFDLSRQVEEFVNYGVIESFKNGLIFSAKYESAMKVFKGCRVVVFSNWAPDRTKLSEDRWEVIELGSASSRASASASRPGLSNEFIFIEDQ